MHRTLPASVLTLALLFAGFLAGARAQDAPGQSSGNVVSAINDVQSEVTQLHSIDELSTGDLTLASATEQVDERRRNALTSAVRANQDGIDDLRSAIEGRSAVTSKLQSSDLETGDVVAASVDEEQNTVTLYYMQ